MSGNIFRANEYDALVEHLKGMGIHTVHMTNGSFGRDNPEKPHQVSATMLAGFEAFRGSMPEEAQGHAFLVAVNSPKSDIESYDHDPVMTSDEQERLNRFLPYLETQFKGDVPVVAVFFDKESAAPVHQTLQAAGINVAREFKFYWGIGEAGSITTGANTEAVAYPYLDQTVPVNAGRGVWAGNTTEQQRAAIWGEGIREAHANKGDVLIVVLHQDHPGLSDGRFGSEAEYLPLLTKDDKPLFTLKNGLGLPGLERSEAPKPEEPGL